MIFYSSSGTSVSLESLQLNCNKRKFVTNNAPKTIKNVVITIRFIPIGCRGYHEVASRLNLFYKL